MNKTSSCLEKDSKLRNKFLKDPNKHKHSYIKQKNGSASFFRKENKEYFTNLNEKDIITDKKNILANC